jgi:hypothetical protein
MFSCPHCGKRTSAWRNKDMFACDSCGVALKTNGRTVHLIANVLAGFGSLVFLAVPDSSLSLQISVMLAAYAAVYFAIILLAFEVRLDDRSGEPY